MTITTNPSRDEYISSAGQTVFNYTFKIYANNELDVYVTPAGQEANDATDITTDYVVDPVTIGDENGGFITFNTPLNSGDAVTIVSGMDYDRTVDYQVNGDFIPSTVNTDNDRQVSQIKQVLELARKAVVFGQAQQSTSGLTSEAPESGKFIRWKSDLSGFENTDLTDVGSLVPLSSIDVIYPTVALMKADSLNVLTPGVTVSTQGYYSADDGGGATYLIAAPQSVDGFGDHTLANNNVALLQSSGPVHVKQYGIFEDGVSDDTLAAQALADSGIGDIISSSTMVVSQISITSDYQVWGGTGGIKCKDFTDATCITITGDYVKFDIDFDGNKANQAVGVGIYVNGATGVTIKDSIIKDSVGTLLLVNNSPSFAAVRNKISGSDGSNVVIQNGSSRSLILKNEMSGSGGDCCHIAYGGSSCNDVGIFGNLFIDNGTSSYDSGLRVTRASRAKISGNTSRNNSSGAGILLSASDGTGSTLCTIENNICNGNNDGITIDDDCNNNIIIGNVCSGNVRDGIDLNDCIQLIASGNHCHNNGEKGILCWGLRHSIIKGNICTDNNTAQSNVEDSGINIQQNATTLTECSNLWVTDNLCRDAQATQTQYAGIIVRGASSDIYIMNNKLSSNETYAAAIIGTSTSCRIEDNNVGGSSTIINDSSSGSNVIKYLDDSGDNIVIAGGIATITHAYHQIDTEGGAASDDLDTLNGATYIGQIVVLKAASTERTIVCKDGTGNLRLSGDFSLDNLQDSITLLWQGGAWVELSASDNGA